MPAATRAPVAGLRDVANDDELVSWLDVSNRVHPEGARTIDELRLALRRNPRQLRTIAYRDGVPVGVAAAVTDTLKDTGALFALVRVLPEHQRTGVGSVLYDHIAAWARAGGGRYFQVTVHEAHEPAMRFWGRRGFVEVEREIIVALDVGAAKPAERAGDPPGITFTTAAERPELLRAVYEVGVQTWCDIPVHEPEKPIAYDVWHLGVTQSPDADPARMFIALGGEQVVGYAELVVPPSTPDIAWHGFTGVLREWRGRGIANALKCRQLQWARDNGMRHLRTGNNADNAPMRHINRQLGYEFLRAELLLRGEL